MNLPKSIRLNRQRGKLVVSLVRYGGGQHTIQGDPTKAATLKKAMRLLAQAEAAYEEKNYFLDPLKTPTFHQAVDEYLEHMKSKISSGHLRSNVSPVLAEIAEISVEGKKMGNIRIGKISRKIISATVVPVLFQKKHKTGKNKINVLKGFFRWCKQTERCNTNPADVPLPGGDEEESNSKIKRISKDIIYNVINSADPAISLAAKTAAFSGMRAGEQIALTWNDVDFDAGVLRINRAMKKGRVVGPPKTKAGRRSIVILDQILNDLREWRVRQPLEQRKNNLVFPDTTGHYAWSDTWREKLQASCAAAKVEKITWNDLRHFYASVLIYYTDETDKTITQLMGHSSLDFTRRQYSHWLEDARRDQQLNTRLSEAFSL